jgi:redox-sensitive bicupin YhaK (pirin superfamily)
LKIIAAKERDLGGFTVRRILPEANHHMVGPFIFFDHMGPAVFPPGKGMEVRPHPHISLATVTYLFEGKIQHRDSLGSDQLIEPGDINWMTAGRGIVHSERTPEELVKSGLRMSGIQLWVALPQEHEDEAPSFVHHQGRTLPAFAMGRVQVKLLLGQAFGHTSPVKVHSDLFYLETVLPAGTSFSLPVLPQHEFAFYVESGEVAAVNAANNATENVRIQAFTMVVETGVRLEIEALKNSRLMWIGGSTLGERFIFWNFVSSSTENLDQAKKDWADGPRFNSRFPPVPGDDLEFIPLPLEIRNPPGNIL